MHTSIAQCSRYVLPTGQGCIWLTVKLCTTFSMTVTAEAMGRLHMTWWWWSLQSTAQCHSTRWQCTKIAAVTAHALQMLWCRSVTNFVVGCWVLIAGIVMALHILQRMFTVRQHSSSEQCKLIIVERKHAVRMKDVKCFELLHKSGHTGM